MFNKYLILGTVNFGVKYGYRNKQFSQKEIFSILNFSKKNNIEYLDTAELYGKSEAKIGKFNWGKKIYTKISIPEEKFFNIKEELQKRFNNSLIKLNSKSVYGIYIHNTDYFLKNKKIQKDVIYFLNSLKKKKS